MSTDTAHRKLTLDGVGSLVLHGADHLKQDIVLRAIAASPREELTVILMSVALGPQLTEHFLEEVGDESLTEEEANEKVRHVVTKPWPTEGRLLFNTAPEDAAEPDIQVVTFDLVEENQTIGAALELADQAGRQDPV